MRRVCIVAVLLISTNAWAEVPSLRTGPVVQVKSKTTATCRLIASVKGTKLWAGDCVAVDLTSEKVELPSIITGRPSDD
jgi:hypothetical protein